MEVMEAKLCLVLMLNFWGALPYRQAPCVRVYLHSPLLTTAFLFLRAQGETATLVCTPCLDLKEILFSQHRSINPR